MAQHSQAHGRVVPYREESTQAWADAVNRTFTHEAVLGAWVIKGVCPRCEHPTAQFVGDMFITKDFNNVRHRHPDPVTLAALTVHCLCDYEHGKGHKGCGAFGNLMNVHLE